MTEIKLNDAFTAEVEAFRAAGEGLGSSGTDIPSEGSLSLQTVNAYQERLTKIHSLVTQFQSLIQKDADDMDALAASLKEADASAVSGG